MLKKDDQPRGARRILTLCAAASTKKLLRIRQVLFDADVEAAEPDELIHGLESQVEISELLTPNPLLALLRQAAQKVARTSPRVDEDGANDGT